MSKRDSIPRTLFVSSCAFFSFVYGFAACTFEWFPHAFMTRALNGEQAPTEIVTASRQKAPRKPTLDGTHHINPARHDLVGVKRYCKVGNSAGAAEVTLITSYWDDHGSLPGLRLIDRDGNTLHHWHVDIRAIWPTSPHRDLAAGQLNHALNYVHGCYLFDNGDVLFNVEYLGLVRMSARGEIRWRLDRRTHHAITRTDDGNFWVCATDWVEDPAVIRRYPGLPTPFCTDQVILVSPEGKVLKNISILDLVYRSKHQALFWTTQHRMDFDVMHLNDVEELPAAMADQYPLFDAGDLLISLRSLNLVMVFDPETLRIKWSAAGQFIDQHDPDFVGNGWISVFDNRFDGTLDGRMLGGTRLVAVRPHSDEAHIIYPRPSDSKHERRFHSGLGGKAQMLPDGRWLITEPAAGRVFEIGKAGNTIWEWGLEPRSDGRVYEVLEGTRYLIGPGVIDRWK